ncbi:MAG: FKBP-type peptidyl-prolyl cis-trans isomerase [Oceanospirillaceae bacterium]|nr:FKBP-type peptidyl-prolyl cis-trans isomerase [Oceanospirillaceae bacterium]
MMGSLDPKILILSLLFIVVGCTESKEEQAFRAQLIDRALNDDNSKLSKAFMLENKLRKGVVTTESGLQYLIITSGSGVNPTFQDKVEVDYEGKLVSGEVFDSSYQRGKSAVFPVKGVVAGWREALLKMKVGDHWQIFLPAQLAYGARSPSAKIAANSALIFDIKLLAIKGENDD